MEIKIWHLTLMIIYIIWTFYSIKTIILTPEDIFKTDLEDDEDDLGCEEIHSSRTPLTNVWIFIHMLWLFGLIIWGLIEICWNKIIITI